MEKLFNSCKEKVEFRCITDDNGDPRITATPICGCWDVASFEEIIDDIKCFLSSVKQADVLYLPLYYEEIFTFNLYRKIAFRNLIGPEMKVIFTEEADLGNSTGTGPVSILCDSKNGKVYYMDCI